MDRFADLFTSTESLEKMAAKKDASQYHGIDSTTALRLAVLLGGVGLATSLYQNKKQKDQLLAEVRKQPLTSNI